MSSNQTPTAFTPAQSRLVQIVFKHLKEAPDADWEAIAAEYPYKSAALARSKFGNALRECNKEVGTPAGATSSKPKATPNKRKDVATDPTDTPTKRARNSKKGKLEVEKEDETEEKEDQTPSKAQSDEDS